MRQHYIPRFIIDGFADESPRGNRGVWTFHANFRRWVRRPTKRTATRDDIYTLIDPMGDADEAIEYSYHKLETRAALFLGKSVNVRQPIGFRPHLCDPILEFCASLVARGPGPISRAHDSLREPASSAVHELTASSERFEQLRQEYREGSGRDMPDFIRYPHLKEAFAASLAKLGALMQADSVANQISTLLAKLSADFIFAPTDTPGFVTSDVPFIVTLNSREEPTAEIKQLIIPLSSKLVIRFIQDVPRNYGYKTASVRQVHQLNAAFIGSAREFLISSSPEVFSEEILDEWASADHEGRSALSQRPQAQIGDA